MNLLAKIARAISAQKPESDGKKKGGAKSWWRWPILIVLVLVGIAVAAWVVGKNRRELAKLRHEKVKREVLAENARALAEAGGEERSAEMRLSAANKALERVEAINSQIRDAEEAYERARADAARITWGDLPRAEPSDSGQDS